MCCVRVTRLKVCAASVDMHCVVFWLNNSTCNPLTRQPNTIATPTFLFLCCKCYRAYGNILKVGEELKKETILLQTGSRIYQLQGLRPSMWYEVKISYPASVGTISIILLCMCLVVQLILVHFIPDTCFLFITTEERRLGFIAKAP